MAAKVELKKEGIITYRMATLRTQKEFRAAGIPDPKTDAMLLLFFVTRMSPAEYYLNADQPMSEEEADEYRRLADKRTERIPLQYILGEQDFCGLTLKVNSHVLIPRQDTEVLVEEAQKVLFFGCRLLDLCTGSGCIVLALAKNRNDAKFFGSDKSKEALSLARENAARCGSSVTFFYSDLFAGVTGRFDVIVCNPPYIPTAQIPDLQPEVALFEPPEALDGGEDGLDFYRKIIPQAPDYLHDGGFLFLEIGFDQREAVTDLMRRAGFCGVRTTVDLSGHDRVVCGQKP